jgi:PAS domain S-box-containing protein
MNSTQENINTSYSSVLTNSIDLAELIPDLVIEIDTKGSIVFMNKNGKEKFQIDDSDILLGISIFSLLRDEDIDNCKKCFENMKNNKDKLKLKCTLFNKSSETFYVILNFSPVYDTYNILRGFLGIIQDISDLTKAEQELKSINSKLEESILHKTIQMEAALTELKTEVSIRKRMSQKLQSAKEELSKAFQQEQDLSQMKSRFISMITHEFRTPLTIIISSANMLEQFYRKGNEDKLFKHLEKIRISSKNLSNLIERTITFGRSNAGMLDVKPEKFDIIHFFDEMMKEIKIFDKNKHRVYFQSDIDSLVVNTDRSLLTTIFNNIISNALKYTNENKSIIIRIDNKLDSVKIKVIDEGIGIPESELNELFKPFQRCSNVGNRQGSGLGLSIVAKFVDLMKGSIQIESKLNVGTKVIIIIPKEYK